MKFLLRNAIAVFILSIFAIRAQAQSISIAASTSDTICSGTMVTFSATASGGSHYKWLKNSAAVGVDSFDYSTAGLSNGDVITCELLSGAGGSILALSAPIVMIVYHYPVVATISGATTVCHLATTPLSDDTVGGIWGSSNHLIAMINPAGVVLGEGAGTDTITYTLTNFCGTASAIHIVTVNTTPVSGPVTGPGTICLGAAVTYTDSSAVTGTWGLTNNTIATISATGHVSSIATGTDTITYSATNSCGTSIHGRTLNIETVPVAGPIAGPNSVCQGDTIHLADPTPGGMWRSNDLLVAAVGAGGPGGPGGPFEVILGTGGGSVTIVYRVANGCGADSVSMNVTVNPVPLVLPITGRDSTCQGGTELLSEYATGGTWSSQAPSIATVDAFGSVTGVAAGVDTIFYTLTNSCGTTTQSYPMTVACPYDVSVSNMTITKGITIYPNPASSFIVVGMTNPSLIQVINNLGQTVKSVKNANTVSISGLPAGVYYVMVFDESGNIAAKQNIVKE